MDFTTKYYLVFGNGQYNTTDGQFTIGSDIYTGITTADVNSNGNDNIDSDVDGSSLTTTLGSMPANLPVICITTDSVGCGNHRYDMGILCASSCPVMAIINNDTTLCDGQALPVISVGITSGAATPDTIQISYFSSPADSASIWGGAGTSFGQVITSTSDTAQLNTPTLPAHSGGSTNDTLFVYAYWQSTPSDPTCRPLDSMQIIIAPNPTVTATATDPTCTNAPPNSDGTITLAGFTTEKYDFVANNTYTGSATYTTATAIPSDGIITSTLVSPASPQIYTIRIFNSDGCSIDRMVTINPAECCGPKKCLPVQVTIRRGSRN